MIEQLNNMLVPILDLYVYNILCICIVCSIFFGLFYHFCRTKQHNKQKCIYHDENHIGSNEKNNEIQKLHDLISDLQIKSSMNTMEIHKLYLEIYELRNKLDQIYANDLQENINYYKNIVLLNEKIEYMQKRMLRYT